MEAGVEARGKPVPPPTYTHPDTGEQVPIPDGAEVVRDDNGDIIGWSNPPETPEGELHPNQVEGYEPQFERSGTERRVLAHITDEDHVGRGPRNTIERLQEELEEDPNTAISVGDGVRPYLDELKAAGLVVESDDGVYSVTDAGQVELAN
jgi:hypothetical protein